MFYIKYFAVKRFENLSAKYSSQTDCSHCSPFSSMSLLREEGRGDRY